MWKTMLFMVVVIWVIGTLAKLGRKSPTIRVLAITVQVLIVCAALVLGIFFNSNPLSAWIMVFVAVLLLVILALRYFKGRPSEG